MKHTSGRRERGHGGMHNAGCSVQRGDFLPVVIQGMHSYTKLKSRDAPDAEGAVAIARGVRMHKILGEQWAPIDIATLGGSASTPPSMRVVQRIQQLRSSTGLPRSASLISQTRGHGGAATADRGQSLTSWNSEKSLR